MKKNVINYVWIFLFVFSIFSVNLFCQSGFKTGVNISNFYGSGANEEGTAHDNFVGPNIGYFKDWNIGKDSLKNYYFSLGFETDLSAKGTIFKHVIFYNQSTDKTWRISDVKRYVYYFEIPLLVKYHYSLFKDVELQVHLGGALSIPTFYSSDGHGGSIILPSLGWVPYSGIDYSLVYGFATSYHKLFFNVRYIKGFAQVDPRTWIRTISFSIGYMVF